jgi:hypothetical protein
MNFGKLLATGQSIMNGRGDISYRSNKQVYLPKFGSATNPFKTEAAPAKDVAAGSVSQTPMQTPVILQPSPVEMAQPAMVSAPAPQARATRVAETELHDATAVANTVVVSQKAPAMPFMPVKREKKASWADKLNPISIFKAAPAEKPMATQTELSLDSVRVVHNDLSDVDVEVVPMKSRSATSEPKPGKSSWEALGERLFGVESTQI